MIRRHDWEAQPWLDRFDMRWSPWRCRVCGRGSTMRTNARRFWTCPGPTSARRLIVRPPVREYELGEACLVNVDAGGFRRLVAAVFGVELESVRA